MGQNTEKPHSTAETARTLTLFVGVRIPIPLPKETKTSETAYLCGIRGLFLFAIFQKTGRFQAPSGRKWEHLRAIGSACGGPE